MSSHRVDLISLFGGVIFLSFGVVGLLHGLGWIDQGALVWVAVVGAVGLGAAGLGASTLAAFRPTLTPAPTASASADPVPSDPVPADPVPREAGQSNPVPREAGQSNPVQSDPVPSAREGEADTDEEVVSM